MNPNRQRTLWCLISFSLLFIFGCQGPAGSGTSARLASDQEGLGPTIGALADVFASDAIPVTGYSLVGGLNGAGSEQCPAQVRTYLEKYILQHLSGVNVNVDELISSPDTAVVIVEGIIPPAASKDQHFDVRVAAVPGTATTSLEGGSLFGADLYEARRFGYSIKSLGIAEGPVYVDLLNAGNLDKRSGYVLGGGTVLNEYKINLALRQPDYRVASQIRNRINERLGYDTAWALAPGSIELRVPLKYTDQKVRFLRLVRATYLTVPPQLVEKRIVAHIRDLATSSNRENSEIALEAIGNAALPRLAALLNSSEPEVRFRAARCMLNLGDQRGLDILRGMAEDRTFPHRVEAIEAIAAAVSLIDVAPMLRSLLRDDDFSVRLAVYKILLPLNDVTISTELVTDGFYLDQIAQVGKPAIFVSRQDRPRVVLFGAPIQCRSDIFVQTPDQTITINAPAGAQSATLICRHPTRSDVIISLKTSLDLADIIRTLSREPVTKTGRNNPGLGVAYSVLVDLLSQMADAGAIQAEFHPGPLPMTLPVRSPQK